MYFKHITRVKFVLFILLLGAFQAAAQQLGGIRGTIMDIDFEVPLPSVKVLVSETGQQVQSSDAGSFYVENVAPGSYTLIFSKGGYTRITLNDVVVSPGRLADVDVEMEGEYEEMAELVVRDIQLGGASEIGLLNLRMESMALMDAVGAEQMSMAGASDAASALKLVSGATVQDGKYAVVRGLPDRYVSSQMNGVRLPTADPDKRAVQLDQFPAVMIESMQVAKTFTPDQQGDASGGAVNVVLKGLPEEFTLKFKAGTKYKTTVNGESFISYEGGGNNFLGTDDGSRDPQDMDGDPSNDKVWTGAYGVSEGDNPFMYDWNLMVGDRRELFGDVTMGAFVSLLYKQDASNYDIDVNDKYWLEPEFQSGLVPHGLVDANDDGVLERDTTNGDSLTSLFNRQKSTDKVQWGWLAAAGIENEDNQLKLLHMHTHIAEDKATVGEDTRGRDLYGGSGGNDDIPDLPYRRAQTLEYIERDSDTLQVSGQHTLPVPTIDFKLPIPGLDASFSILKPEIDWTIADSYSHLDSPDKRIFGSLWTPGYVEVIPESVQYVFNPVTGGFEWVTVPATTNTVEAIYSEDKPNASTLGHIQRIWKNIEEESEQYFINGKLPFEQWTGDEGAVHLGFFNDKTTRKYDQDSFSNTRTFGDISWQGEWDEYWSDNFHAQALANPNAEQYQMHETFFDVDYLGQQKISAWYYMVDLPITSFLKVKGGTRFESTSMSIAFDAEEDVLWYDFEKGALASFKDNPPPNVPIDQDDLLPSWGFELKPTASISVRGNYSETIARPTFKEYAPIAQFEYVGGDIFIGNSALTMSSLRNYDLRADWSPYPGGLVSVSWFKKELEDPIEYQQRSADNVGIFTTSVNYPDGVIDGFEVELRQHLGQFFDDAEGLSIGGNLTLIDSSVTIPDEEVQRYVDNGYGFVEQSRDMLNAPEYLYNLYTTYELESKGLKAGLFYTVKGDTLITGASTYGEYIPSVYAQKRGTLNLSISKEFSKHLKLSFKVKNITDAKVEQVYRSEGLGEEVLKSSYKKGVEYSLGLSGSW